MTWVVEEGFSRRPLVVVEDHLYHTTELLERLACRSSLYGHLTVVSLDRPGPDTDRTAAGWLAAFPGLQVMAAAAVSAMSALAAVVGGTAGPDRDAAARFRPLPAGAFDSPQRLGQALAGALRPGGLLLQDVQLETLTFIPADRWWESIFLASTVRGMFGGRPPVCRFFSNKRGYEATFGRDLLDAGFDPRDVIDKADLDRSVVPTLGGFLDRAFPHTLRLAAPGRRPWELRVARDGGEREEVERALDLVLWGAEDGARELGGRALARSAAADPAAPPGIDTAAPAAVPRRILFKPGSQEAVTWRSLLADRLDGGDGLPVLDVGGRLAPPDAGRAEITNLAARHLHTLRGRLDDPTAIATAHHRYRLGERLLVGLAEGSRPDPAAPLNPPT